MVDSEEAVAEALLKAVGVDDHEPEVVGMVLDAMHRAARDALGDARDLALHRNETKIEAHDVRAGDDLNAAAGYSRRPPPARENAIAAAASVNAAPLNLADGHGACACLVKATSRRAAIRSRRATTTSSRWPRATNLNTLI